MKKPVDHGDGFTVHLTGGQIAVRVSAVSESASAAMALAVVATGARRRKAAGR